MEYYSAMKTNEIILFAGKQVELEVTMLREVSKLRRTKVECFFSYYVETKPKR
jgi:hypothetical protein